MTPVRILVFGTYDVRAHPRVDVLVRGLRENGHEVVEVNRPLGLDTAQRILERHSGYIRVESKPGETCFQVRLPLEQAQAY